MILESEILRVAEQCFMFAPDGEHLKQSGQALCGAPRFSDYDSSFALKLMYRRATYSNLVPQTQDFLQTVADIACSTCMLDRGICFVLYFLVVALCPASLQTTGTQSVVFCCYFRVWLELPKIIP